MTRPEVEFALEVAAWWVVCVGIWLLSLSGVPLEEVVVAVPSGLPCALLAVAARRASTNAWRFRPQWFIAVLGLPVNIVTDTVQVLFAALPWRKRTGYFTEITVSGGAGEGALASGRRAVATMVVSLSPGSFVTDINAETGSMTVHVLPGGDLRAERMAAR